MKNNDITTISCCHSLRIGSLCAVCGAEIVSRDDLIPALHSSDKLVLIQSEALALHKARNESLEKHKKMILILDLDQTLLHSTFQESYCDFTFTLFFTKFYVKLRPFLKKFLRKMSKLFEIHVYTMGTRDYASEICRNIDPTGRIFGDRIVTRCENFNEMKKSIDRITSIHSNVVILDDRADVWDYSSNLVLIKPFYFNDEIDVNDPSKKPMYIPDSPKSENIVVSIPEKQSENTNLDINSKFDSIKTESNIPLNINASSDHLKLTLKIDPRKFNEEAKINDEIIKKDVSSNSIPIQDQGDDNNSANGSHEQQSLHTLTSNDESKESINPLDSSVDSNNNLQSSEIIQTIPDNSQFTKERLVAIQNPTIQLHNNIDGMSKDNQSLNSKSICSLDVISRSRLMDRELLRAIKTLKKVHQKYFETKKNAGDLLRIKSLKRIRIASGGENFNLILFSGATLDLENPSLVIDNWELAEKFKVLNVGVNWLYKCIYERKAIATLPFLISDHREKFNDNNSYDFFLS